MIERDAVPAGSTALSAGLIPAAGHALSARARHRGFRRTVRRGHCAQGAWRGGREARARCRERRGADGRMAGRHLRDAVRGHHRLQLSGPFGASHARPAEPHRRRADRPAAQRRGGARHSDPHRAAFAKRCSPTRTASSKASRLRGGGETIGCGALVLACNGYGGNAELVRRHIPDMGDALYFGHPGNQGDAVLWGEALGARLAALSGYQGHGSVATPHNILITWAAIMEGGFQVNAQGRRFHNEALGYSEAAAQVLRQPGGMAFDIFDARIAGVARQFEDFRNAEKAGALITRRYDRAVGEPHRRCGGCVAGRTERDRFRARQAGSLRPRFSRRIRRWPRPIAPSR